MKIKRDAIPPFAGAHGSATGVCLHEPDDRLPYLAWHTDAERRYRSGERQWKCPNCMKWIWAHLWRSPNAGERKTTMNGSRADRRRQARANNLNIATFAPARGSAVVESAQDLESHARTLIKHRHTAPEWMWENLANSVNRLNAARQAYELSQLPNVEVSGQSGREKASDCNPDSMRPL